MNNDFDHLNHYHHYFICFALALQTTILQNLYKYFNKISFTNSKIYLAFINKFLHKFQIVFSNIFTHQTLEKYIFLLLHLSSLTKTSPSFMFIIIVIISFRCVLFMTCFNIGLFMLLFCRCPVSTK
jgi:CRP-like cAMP-binding protein